MPTFKFYKDGVAQTKLTVVGAALDSVKKSVAALVDLK